MTAPATDPRDDVTALVEGVKRGERASLARLLSLVERRDPTVGPGVASLATHTGGAYTIGVTGAPGSGKSSLTDRLVAVLRARGDEVAVLAIDPSSPRTGGAILGDRVRMGAHATDPGVFIRSMATRGQLGGLAAAAPQAVRVLDASGAPWIVVETVGVGQVELDVAGATDTTVVVVTPGWGDGVQANKAGLLEVADVFVVNKADRPGADLAVRDLAAMLDLSPGGAWTPPIVETVATTGEGVEHLWEAVTAHREHLTGSGELALRRRARLRDEVRRMVRARLVHAADAYLAGAAFESLVDEADGAVDPYALAGRVVVEEFGIVDEP